MRSARIPALGAGELAVRAAAHEECLVRLDPELLALWPVDARIRLSQPDRAGEGPGGEEARDRRLGLDVDRVSLHTVTSPTIELVRVAREHLGSGRRALARGAVVEEVEGDPTVRHALCTRTAVP
jgi:hypothetical protein